MAQQPNKNLYSEVVWKTAELYSNVYATLKYNQYCQGNATIENIEDIEICTSYFPIGGYYIYIRVSRDELEQAELIKSCLKWRFKVNSVSILF